MTGLVENSRKVTAIVYYYSREQNNDKTQIQKVGNLFFKLLLFLK